MKKCGTVSHNCVTKPLSLQASRDKHSMLHGKLLTGGRKGCRHLLVWGPVCPRPQDCQSNFRSEAVTLTTRRLPGALGWERASAEGWVWGCSHTLWKRCRT